MTSRLLIMGPQGAGKGTQAALLADQLGIPAISTGDIFRANIKGGTELGKKAQEYVTAGGLVPDSLTDALVRSRLEESDTEYGFILDGYPRNVAQVDALDVSLAGLGWLLDAVILLTADRGELLTRIAKRAQIEGRADDTPEAIEQRLSIYERETAPLADAYRARRILLEVDGMGEVDEVHKRIVTALRELALQQQS